MLTWESNVRAFIMSANESGLRMLMVGGGAVNWHGYKRHSADVDFWIDTATENLDKLLQVLRSLGYDIDVLPEAVKQGQQNVSLKFSPVDIDVELITKFDVNKPFDEAYKSSRKVVPDAKEPTHYWHVLSYDDLIISKLKSGRPKDYLDVQELQRLRSRSE